LIKIQELPIFQILHQGVLVKHVLQEVMKKLFHMRKQDLLLVVVFPSLHPLLRGKPQMLRTILTLGLLSHLQVIIMLKEEVFLMLLLLVQTF